MTCTNTVLFLPLLVARSWQRARGLPTPEQARSDFRQPPALVNDVLEPGECAVVRPSDFRQPPALVNDLLSALLSVEARVVRLTDLPFGSTVVCLARKPLPEPPADAS